MNTCHSLLCFHKTHRTPNREPEVAPCLIENFFQELQRTIDNALASLALSVWLLKHPCRTVLSACEGLLMAATAERMPGRPRSAAVVCMSVASLAAARTAAVILLSLLNEFYQNTSLQLGHITSVS